MALDIAIPPILVTEIRHGESQQGIGHDFPVPSLRIV